MKRLISIILSVMMVMSVTTVGTTTFSAKDSNVQKVGETYKGTCGNDVNWALNTSTGELSITGSGLMRNYTKDSAPWNSNKSIIKAVNVAKDVTNISVYAFYNCTILETVKIESSVTVISANAFYNCSALKNVYYNGTESQWNSIGIGAGNSFLTNATKHFKESESTTEKLSIVTGVCGSKLKWSLDTSTGVLNITGTEDMSNYSKHSHWEYNGSYYDSYIKTVTISDSVTSIGEYAFNYCDNLKSILIPSSVTSIGSYAFQDCSNLKSITIPNSVTSIGYEAFCDCKSLTSVSIPNNLTEIEQGTFCGCDNLKSVVIPSSITSIGADAFAWCTSLKNVVIPSSVTSIGANAFNICSNLKDVYYTGKISVYNNISIGSGNECLNNAKKHYLNTETEISYVINDSETINVNTSDTIKYIVFKPTKTAEYTIQSKGNYDPLGVIYDSNFKKLSSNKDISDIDNNFKITLDLTAGKIYYIGIKMEKTGSTKDYKISTSFKEKQTITGVKKSYTKTYGCKAFSLNAKAKTKLTYKSSNEKIAKVSTNGKVTLKGLGTATITIKAKGNSTYKAAKKKIVTIKSKLGKVKISKPKVSGHEEGRIKIKFTCSKPKGTKYFLYKIKYPNSTILRPKENKIKNNYINLTVYEKTGWYNFSVTAVASGGKFTTDTVQFRIDNHKIKNLKSV